MTMLEVLAQEEGGAVFASGAAAPRRPRSRSPLVVHGPSAIVGT